MKWKKITGAFLGVGLVLTLPSGNSWIHAEDETTWFDIIYKDSAGYTVGKEMIPASSSDDGGDLILREDQLNLPEGFVLNETWQTYSTAPGEDLRIWFAVAAQDPLLEQAYASQASHPVQTAALTLNYRLSDGTLVKTKTFLFEQRMGNAGGAEVPMFLDQDYVVSAPQGYALLTSPSSQYTALLNARTSEDIYVTPSDAVDAASADDGATMVRLSFYNPANELIALQTIPFYGTGEVRLDPAHLELPEGYVLNQRWQDYYSSAGTDFAARLSIARADGSEPGSIFASLPQNGGSADLISGTRRASSVNTAARADTFSEMVLHLSGKILRASPAVFDRLQ